MHYAFYTCEFTYIASLADILNESPSIDDAFKCLRNASAIWDDIGRELEIERNYRKQLRTDPTMSADSKLERVLEKWIEGMTCEVTWQKMIDVLSRLDRKDIAKDVKKFHSLP